LQTRVSSAITPRRERQEQLRLKQLLGRGGTAAEWRIQRREYSLLADAGDHLLRGDVAGTDRRLLPSASLKGRTDEDPTIAMTAMVGSSA
ncbi:hypothetical protein, partial [Mesorhizobium sp. M5C.F.Ca.IN.020.32.2.1]|uniref:hypothetical protein n=1 Tax=Mesorhizobium sp. M5C.F.Ca.IN.020.32.2.1 TaxID=2496771 RepID=UPI0019D48406